MFDACHSDEQRPLWESQSLPHLVVVEEADTRGSRNEGKFGYLTAATKEDALRVVATTTGASMGATDWLALGTMTNSLVYGVLEESVCSARVCIYGREQGQVGNDATED